MPVLAVGCTVLILNHQSPVIISFLNLLVVVSFISKDSQWVFFSNLSKTFLSFDRLHLNLKFVDNNLRTQMLQRCSWVEGRVIVKDVTLRFGIAICKAHMASFSFLDRWHQFQSVPLSTRRIGGAWFGEECQF